VLAVLFLIWVRMSARKTAVLSEAFSDIRNTLQADTGKLLELSHNSFLQHPFGCIIHNYHVTGTS
jgi:hypothetical protein